MPSSVSPIAESDPLIGNSQRQELLLSSAPALDALRLEAEAMTLSNYRIETIEFASGGAVASFWGGAKGERGSASFEFNGLAGQYDIVVGYFDEEGGKAGFDLLLNDQALGQVIFDQRLGSRFATAETWVRRTVGQGILLQQGDRFEIAGFEDANEHARIDYVEFVPVPGASLSQADSPDGPLQTGNLLPSDGISEAIRINSGGEAYVDSLGQTWLADQFFVDGSAETFRDRIWGTPDDPLYQSQRSARTLDYHIPVANGLYQVSLLFAEMYPVAQGDRRFDIVIEGQVLDSRFDIKTAAGGRHQALSQNYQSILVTDGQLDIHLHAIKDYAKLAGLEIVAKGTAPLAALQSPSPIRINAGGESYTDSMGQQWLADTFFDDGRTSSKQVSIHNSNDDVLYQTERYAKTLDYKVPVANGTYDLNLLFAENHWQQANQRLFDIAVEGKTYETGFDILTKVGRNTALTHRIRNIQVTDGYLSLALTARQDHAKLAGFEILPVSVADPGLIVEPAPAFPDLLLPTTPAGATSFSAAATLRYITPNGKGDGRSWQQAASLSQLDSLIEQSQPGDEIWIAGDLGTYSVAGKPISVDSGGSQGKPIYIRGVASQAGGESRPLFVGDRAEGWLPGQADGGEVFRLLQGANYLHFSNFNFQNVGNGAFRFGGDLTGITLEAMEARNVRRFVENSAAAGAQTASVTDLTIRQVNVLGFSKSAIRLQYDSHGVLIEDVFGDSQHQDGDQFAMGVHLHGTVHDVVHRRVTMNNATQRKDEASYWNADGFATDWGTYDITYEDTAASGSTDGGYDLKSANTLLIRAAAADNKRNFRIWRNATMIDVVSDEPFRRGGTGTAAHIHVLGDEGNLYIKGGTFSGDRNLDNIIFDLDDKGSLIAEGAIITDNRYRLYTVEQGKMDLKDLIEP